MPANLVKTKHDEALWNRAKTQAAKEGKAENWAYVTTIFENMKGRRTAAQRRLGRHG